MIITAEEAQARTLVKHLNIVWGNEDIINDIMLLINNTIEDTDNSREYITYDRPCHLSETDIENILTYFEQLGYSVGGSDALTISWVK